MAETVAPRRRIVYLSGTRADFGLMQSTLQRLSADMDLAVAVTGTHLSAAFGHTLSEIQAAGLRVCGDIPVDVTTRTPLSMAVAVGDCLKGMAALLDRERPDLLLLLGDRGEMLAGAVAALHLGLVCVHIHGGERSGTVDEPMRHAISKLSHYHCVATQGSRERLIRMGEDPARILVSGAPGLDGLDAMGQLTPAQTCAALALPSAQPFLLVLFHPVVQQAGDAYTQTVALCQGLQAVGLPVVWLAPNADAGSLDVLRALDDTPLPAGSQRRQHLPRELFFAAMRHCVVMVGNSSAGIIEAASFGTPVVNVGQRQCLRERNANVSDVAPDATAICQAVEQALQHGRRPCENVYGDGAAGARIARWLAGLSLDRSVLNKVNAY